MKVWLLDWIDYDNRGGQATAFATAEAAMLAASDSYKGRWKFSLGWDEATPTFSAMDAAGAADPCPEVWQVDVGT